MTLSQPVVVDVYQDNRTTGAFIIVDRLSNITVGAGMVSDVFESVASTLDHSAFSGELKQLVKQHYADKSDDDIDVLVKKFISYL